MKKYISTALLALTLVATGCRDWLDINDNPNYVSEAEMSDLLPTAQLLTATKVGYDLGLVGNFWSQYVVQGNETNQYNNIMDYNLAVSESLFSSIWSYSYSRILPSLKSILSKSAATENSSNFELEAKTLAAYNIYLLTSLYDKVALSEGSFSDEPALEPNFDSGKEVQDALVKMLEEVRSINLETAAEDESVKNPSAACDMVFGGNVEAWLQFANTIYLKVLIRDFNANKSKIQSLLAEDNLLASDAKFDQFVNQADKSNPLYESDRRQLNTTENIRCCADILNILDATDPRLAYYYEGGALGTPYGTKGKQKETSRLAIDATDPVYFGTVSEALFLKAEAYARLGNSAKAKESYEAAIEESFARCGVSGADEFLEGAYSFKAGSAEEMVHQIINQKWASNVRSLPIESWFDINRTGYPKRGTDITLYTGVLEAPACRYLYPESSALYNRNSPEVEPLTAPMWWHKQ
ncbi:MAG: SusD/RagB family nutrient-binding outer membrane lipoprotein [Candidatus Cryptobacteroides sp.]